MNAVKTFEIDTDAEGQLEYFRLENYNLSTENKRLKGEKKEPNKSASRNELLIKAINRSLEPDVVSENKRLKKMLEDQEQKIAEMSNLLEICDKKLEDFENDYKDIKVALEADSPDESLLQFYLRNPASKKGGDKYETTQDKEFMIYVPQKYSRLNGVPHKNMFVKLSFGDDFAEVNQTN
jgi:hypothetical protein